VCPESVVQVVRRHPDTVYYNGWNKSLCHALTRDQQHHIGAEDHPTSIDQSLDKSSCSSFGNIFHIVSWFVINNIMNYLSIYNSIMQQARNRTLEHGFERHHVIPKSLGGANNLSNLVQLTLREHFVAHKLLTRIHTGPAQKKMWFAYYRLCNRHRHTTSRMYEQAKLQAKQYLSEIHTGKTISEAHKTRLSKLFTGSGNPNYNKKHTKQALEFMSSVKVGNTNARVGVDIVDFQTNALIESFNSIADLCKGFDLTRGQAEHYIYKQVPYNGMLFVRQKIIKRK
jgi:hypothetical protein